MNKKITVKCKESSCGKDFEYESKEVLGSLMLGKPAGESLSKEVFYLKCPHCGNTHRYEV